MFAVGGILLVFSGFYAFLAFRLAIGFAETLLFAGVLLVGWQLANNIRAYRAKQLTRVYVHAAPDYRRHSVLLHRKTMGTLGPNIRL
jgi:hypothetical protein